jgi:hypothetical protein
MFSLKLGVTSLTAVCCSACVIVVMAVCALFTMGLLNRYSDACIICLKG